MAVAAHELADEIGVLAEGTAGMAAPVLDAVPGPVDGGQDDREAVHIHRQPGAAAEIVQVGDTLPGHGRPSLAAGSRILGPHAPAAMSPLRPDLVDCWIFRVADPATSAVEILLIRRSPGRILPGLWQCVSGSLEPDERVAIAALREVAEETGYGPDSIEAFYDLDLINQFHEPSVDAVLVSAVFAVRVRGRIEPALSPEHTSFRWLSLEAAWQEVVWPGYRDAIERIRDHLLDSDKEPWFRLGPEGRRLLDG